MKYFLNLVRVPPGSVSTLLNGGTSNELMVLVYFSVAGFDAALLVVASKTNEYGAQSSINLHITKQNIYKTFR